MISAGELRKNKKVMYEGAPYYVVDFMHVKMGRGRPHVKAKMKHLLTGQVIEKSFLTTESFEEPDLENRDMQYLYSQGEEYIFMDSTTYDQIHVDAEHLGNTRWYLMENEEYSVLFFEGSPAVKGDTVSNVMKPATVETGYSVKVPLFVKEGDKIKIDTRSGEYIERAN